MGVGLGVQLVPLGSLGFLDSQHITDVILLGRCCVTAGISHKSFHYFAIQRNGVLCPCQRIKGIALNLIDAALGSIDRLLERHRLGVFSIGQCNVGGFNTNGNLFDLHLAGGIHIDLVPLRCLGFF